MSVGLADIIPCLVGFVFPYAMFLRFYPPYNLRFETTHAGKIEKLSYRWLKPTLIVAGIFGASAAYSDRHSNDAFVFGALLTAMFAVSVLAFPAGMIAFRHSYGWDKNRKTRRR